MSKKKLKPADLAAAKAAAKKRAPLLILLARKLGFERLPTPKQPVNAGVYRKRVDGRYYVAIFNSGSIGLHSLFLSETPDIRPDADYVMFKDRDSLLLSLAILATNPLHPGPAPVFNLEPATADHLTKMEPATGEATFEVKATAETVLPLDSAPAATPAWSQPLPSEAPKPAQAAAPIKWD